jgi:endonuclease YncB( thermonuclease family)
MRCFILILAVFSASQSLAAGAIVRDGGTVQVGGVTYRLDGIDAPELDQICIDEHADAWACGVEARDQLANLIGSRQARCEDLGLGTTYKKRHIGICTVEGESASLNQLLVRQGFALNFEPYARGRFREDEAAAKDNRRGLWKGCFVAPRNSAGDERTALYWAIRAGLTKIARSAPCSSRMIPPCRRVAASRVNLPCVPASPEMWASIICRRAAVTRLSPSRIAGFALRKMPRPQASGKRIIAAQPNGDGCNKSVAQQN